MWEDIDRLCLQDSEQIPQMTSLTGKRPSMSCRCYLPCPTGLDYILGDQVVFSTTTDSSPAMIMINKQVFLVLRLHNACDMNMFF